MCAEEGRVREEEIPLSDEVQLNKTPEEKTEASGGKPIDRRTE